MTIIRRGSRGETVRMVQRILHLVDDGIFGAITQEAVIAFQESAGLTADGIVGAATMAALMKRKAAEVIRLRKSKRKIREIIVHCTDTPDGRNHTVEDITKWHKEKGWATIGYHYVVDINGKVLEGRDIDLVGAHCYGHNTYSIGVVYVGGRDRETGDHKDTRTELQKNAIFNLLIDLKKLYPDAQIYGHHDFDKYKPCPCFDARTEYRRL